MDEDTYDAACAQQESDERRQREDEALERCRILTEEAHAEWANYKKWSTEWWKRTAA